MPQRCHEKAEDLAAGHAVRGQDLNQPQYIRLTAKDLIGTPGLDVTITRRCSVAAHEREMTLESNFHETVCPECIAETTANFYYFLTARNAESCGIVELEPW